MARTPTPAKTRIYGYVPMWLAMTARHYVREHPDLTLSALVQDALIRYLGRNGGPRSTVPTVSLRRGRPLRRH